MSTHTDTDHPDQSFNPQTTNKDLQEGDKLYFQSRYFEAHEFYVSFLKQTTESQENNLSDLAPLYHKLGLSALKIGSFSDSISYLAQALEIIQSREEASPLEKARVLSALGESLFKEARYSEAEERYIEAQEILEDLDVEKNKELMCVFNGYAHIGIKQESIEEALECLDMAEKMGLQKIIPTSIALATTYFLYSYIFLLQNKNEKANEYIQKALMMRQQIYGQSHVEIAQCYIILGRIAQQKEQYSEALEYYNQGQNMLINLLGYNHLELAKGYFGMFCVYHCLEDYETSCLYYERAMVMKEKFLSPNHLNLALNYAISGDMISSQGKVEDAKYLYRRALDIFYARDEVPHSKAEECLDNLANLTKSEETLSIVETYLDKIVEIYKQFERHPQARRMLKKKLAIQLRILDKNDHRVAQTYTGLALLYYNGEKIEKALKNVIESIKINNSQKERVRYLANFCIKYNLFQMYSHITSQEDLLKKIRLIGKPEYFRFLIDVQHQKCLTDLNSNFNI